MRNKTSAVAEKFKQLSMLRLIAMAALPLGMLLGVTAQGQTTPADPNANDALEACDADQSGDGEWNDMGDTYTAYIGQVLDGGTPDLGSIQLPVLCGTAGGTYALEKQVDGEYVEVDDSAFTVAAPTEADPDATAPAVAGLTIAAGTAGTSSFEIDGTATAAGTHMFQLEHEEAEESFEFTIVVKNVPVAPPTFGADAAAAAGNVGAYSSKTVWANVTLPDAAGLPLTANDDNTAVNEEYTLEVKVTHGTGMMERTLAERETVLRHDGSAGATTHDEGGGVVSLTIDINNRNVLTAMAEDSTTNRKDVMVKARVVRSDDQPGKADDSAYASVALTLPASPTIGTVSTGVSETWHLHSDATGVENSVFVVKPNFAADGTTPLDDTTDPVSEPDIRGDTAAARIAAGDGVYSYMWGIVSDDKKVATVVANTDGDSLIEDDLFIVTAGYEGSRAMDDTTITVRGTEVGCMAMDDRCRVVREVIKIVVLKNRAPIFAVTEATIRWVENDAAQMVNLKAEFVLPGVVQDADEGQPLEFALLNADGEAIGHVDDRCVKDGMVSKTSRFYVTKNGMLGVSRSGADCLTLGINFDAPGGESHELTVQASDGQGGTDVLALTIDVRNVNEAPAVNRAMAAYEAPALIDGGKTMDQFSVDGRFTDPEGDALCYVLGDGASNTYFKVEGSGPSSCGLPNFTITLISPSVEADTPAPGYTNVVTHMFTIGVTEASGDNKLSSEGMVTVTVRGVYGQNLTPLIWGGRADDSVTNAPYLSEWEVDENSMFEATFTAQDVQPTNDRLCFKLPQWGPLSFNRYFVRGADPYEKCMDDEDDEDGVFKAEVYEYAIAPAGSPFHNVRLDYESTKGVISSNLTVTDLSGASATFPFTIKIKDLPEGPVQTKALPDLYGVVGDEPITIDLNSYFRDGDGDELTCKSTSSDSSVKRTDSDCVLTLELSSADISGTKVATINLEVSDPTQQRIYADFMVTLKNSNEAPMFDNAVTAVTWTVAENSRGGTAVGAAMTATDADKDDVSYDLEQSKECAAGTSTANCFSIDTKGQVKVAGSLNHEYMDMHMITLVAMDMFGGASYLEATIEVADVNERPTLEEEIVDRESLVGVESCFDANAHFMDVDARDQAAGLLFETSINRRATASVEVEGGNMICVTGLEPGNAVATVTATDRGSQMARDRFKITVVENQVPTVAMAIAPDGLTIQENGRTDDIDLSGVFDDGDMDYDEMLTYAVSVDSKTVATATLVGADDMLRIYGDMKGSTEVTVTATDQNDNMVSDMFTLTVERNEAPMAGMVADVTTRVGLPASEVSLDNAFTDDGDTFTMVASTDNPDVATAAVAMMADGSSVLRVMPHSVGSATGKVTATDTADNTAYVKFNISVAERNDAPTVAKGIDDMEVEVGGSITIALDGVFKDSDELMIEVMNEDEDVADVIYRGSKHEIRAYGVAVGSTAVTVTATDTVDQMVDDDFIVTVIEATNAAPTTVGTIAGVTVEVGDDAYEMDVGEYFLDPDGDALWYTTYTEGSAVNVTNFNESVTLEARSKGSATVHVIATDPDGLFAIQSFDVTASDGALKEVANAALAGYGRAMISSVSTTIASRIDSNREDRGFGFSRFNQAESVPDASSSAFGQEMTSSQHPESIQSSLFDWDSAAYGGAKSAKQVPQLNMNRFITLNNFSKNLNGKGGKGWSVWSSADAQNFEGSGYLGKTATSYLGVDVQKGDSLLFGVTVSRNRGTSDYTHGAATQTLDTSLTTVLPYVNYAPSSKTNVWAVLGRGAGAAETTVVNLDNESSDLAMNKIGRAHV